MIEVLYHSENVVFTSCLAIFFLLTFLEIIFFMLGFGVSSLFDSIIPEFELPAPGSPNIGKWEVLLGWLTLGQIPPYFFLLLFLATFGTIGSLLQYAFFSVLDSPMVFWLAVPIAFVLSVPFIRVGVKLIKKALPKEDTSALMENEIIGKIVNIPLGQATYDTSAEAKFVDKHGQTHYIMIVSADKNKCYNSQDDLIVVKKEENHLYRVKRF